MPDAVATLSAALEGRYRIERELGEGGMATVYLAADLRHERKVALKVLRPELAALVGADRFLAEIKTTANLQHPNILPLFDSGEAGSYVFYVMPFIEGETVASRLVREHQLPVDEAVEIARIVAEALDYAHRRGVIHRDIKPSNILLQDGKPVLADFGIALALGVAGGNRLTETGLTVGTPLYMSPEQATGEAHVGAATDVYALGCVLYEMLVGQPPYTGGTPQVILAKIITSDPVSATKQRRSVPAHVDRAIQRALEKLPADRFKTAGDFAKALTDARTIADGSAAVGSAAPGPWKRIAIGLGFGVVALGLVSVWALSSRARPTTGSVARFDVTPTEAQRLERAAAGIDIALSPDGSRMVYVGVAPGGRRQLWVRDFSQLAATPVAGTEDASGPDISPDGRSVVYGGANGIRTIPLDGGPAGPVLAPGGDPTWGADGSIYFVDDGRVFRLPREGGAPIAMTTPKSNTIHQQPAVLPDGRGLLVSVVIGAPPQSRIAVVGPEGGEARELLAGTMARYSPTGHLVYLRADGTLMAAPFDLRRLDVTGPSVALVAGVEVSHGSAAEFALSASGALVYGTGAGSVAEAVWVGRDGLVTAVDSTWTGDLSSPALSPDGRQLAVAIQGESSMDIWVKQLDRGPSLRLTTDGERNDFPVWSPDGRLVTFTSNRASPSFDIWSARADGTGGPRIEHDEPRAIGDAIWSPDMQWLVYRTSTNERGRGDILSLRRGVAAAPVPVASSGFTELAPTISPNGRWMAYSSTETGRSEIVVVPFPNTGGGKWPVSAGGGSEPAWSRKGDELFYRNSSRELVAVQVTTSPTFTAGPTRVLFSTAPYRLAGVHRQYDVGLDGQRFVMIRPVGGGVAGRLVLVQGFARELGEQLPR